MSIFGKKITIATHDGRFHADDIFACAVLQIVLKNKARIIRTRDAALINAADYVVDVGGEYDVAKKRFDHHQIGAAGNHANGVPMASFGLVWREYGAAISGTREIAARIEQRLVCPIDSEDNGVSLYKPESSVLPYTLQSFLYLSRPTWREDSSMYDVSFLKMVKVAQDIILREVVATSDFLLAETNVVRAYNEASDKRVIILDDRYPYHEFLTKYSEPIYVIIPSANKTQWKVETVCVAFPSFESRKPLPKAWAGLRDAELAKVTGVADAVFCHNARFLVAAKSKEGAVALATLALQAPVQ